MAQIGGLSLRTEEKKMAFDFTKLTAAKGDYYNKTTGIGDNTETTLIDDAYIQGRCRGQVSYFESDKSGNMKIYFIDRDNEDKLMQTVAVTADVLSVIDFDYLLLRYKITFTRTDTPYTGDATTKCECKHYGASK
jgi:hypothetical protein